MKAYRPAHVSSWPLGAVPPDGVSTAQSTADQVRLYAMVDRRAESVGAALHRQALYLKATKVAIRPRLTRGGGTKTAVDGGTIR
jgi:hypothetical protein